MTKVTPPIGVPGPPIPEWLTYDELLGRVLNYLNGETDLVALKTWYWPGTWNMHKRAAPNTQDLAGEVSLLLCEHDHGDWTEGQVRDQLREMVCGSADAQRLYHAPITLGNVQEHAIRALRARTRIVRPNV